MSIDGTVDTFVLKEDDEHGRVLSREALEKRGLVMTDEPYDRGYMFRRGKEAYRGMLLVDNKYMMLKQDNQP